MIKRLDLYIIKNFLTLFFATFFICSFIVMMQFLWMYVDEIIGKGLPMSALGQLFFFNFLTSMPLALPLAILLASLMTFGNMGEQLELLAMKTAGISLFRIMRPLIVLIISISIGAFFFSNNVIPLAKKKMYTILFSIKNKSPELDIPIGQFYDGVNNMKMYVRSKDLNTGALKNIMIYDFSKGFDNASVTTADTMFVDMAADMNSLQFKLINGESFENLEEEQKNNFKKESIPYRRETFKSKTIIIEFDANFNMYDENNLNDQHISKDYQRLRHEVDSIQLEIDSMKTSYADEFVKTDNITKIYRRTYEHDSLESNSQIDIDTLIYSATRSQLTKAITKAKNKAATMCSEQSYRRSMLNNASMFYAEHAIEMHRKFTLSFACFVFFFIGAPLGAIIRKGGLGMPVVISVTMFIIYFIIDTSSINLAREGVLDVWEGMWLSSFVLLPIGIFLTYKAAKDSTLFNAEAYKLQIKKIITFIRGLLFSPRTK